MTWGLEVSVKSSVGYGCAISLLVVAGKHETEGEVVMALHVCDIAGIIYMVLLSILFQFHGDSPTTLCYHLLGGSQLSGSICNYHISCCGWCNVIFFSSDITS